MTISQKEQLSVIPSFFKTSFCQGKNEQSLIYNRMKHLICKPINVKQNRQPKPSQKFLRDPSGILIKSRRFANSDTSAHLGGNALIINEPTTHQPSHHNFSWPELLAVVTHLRVRQCLPFPSFQSCEQPCYIRPATFAAPWRLTPAPFPSPLLRLHHI